MTHRIDWDGIDKYVKRQLLAPENLHLFTATFTAEEPCKSTPTAPDAPQP